jgi:RHS repeat-associated protein
MQRLANDSFLFTGQYFDSEIEEYYLRARQYNPHLSRPN